MFEFLIYIFTSLLFWFQIWYKNIEFIKDGLPEFYQYNLMNSFKPDDTFTYTSSLTKHYRFKVSQ